MVAKQVRDGRMWYVEVLEDGSRYDNEVVFCNDRDRVVVKAKGLVIVVENKSTKELNHE